MTDKTCPVGVGEVARIRSALVHRAKMRNICLAFPAHSRDTIVEIIDAIHRYNDNQDAAEHANWVLAGQAAGVKFINGREQPHMQWPGSGASPLRQLQDTRWLRRHSDLPIRPGPDF
jgi:hypothetical protein